MSKTSFLSAFFAMGLVCFSVFAFATEPTEPVVSPVPTKAVAPAPHCQVPCGIYGDEMRFEGMLEDTQTIAKAISQIEEFATGLEAGTAPTAKGMNQMVRWVTTKEAHAQNIQDVMAEYFFAQRIKSDHKDYTAQLATAHKVIVCAMKCKQDASAPTAEALNEAILNFYRAYEGKEPKFHEEEK
ncbi:superoxide dismutase [Ni] [Mariniblastus fucicola]|uniref:Nickel-containing superoxide dismutase n=1 Tax=Mariniblastus fucicola TaxID=980251 RepID=A0A5B9P7E0_9BACT|nr:superoxide dismutase [Ni] [Mariniblastus fucicola]QEG22557.1 Nickel-containing superoxide dismutase [Mariniblastus fucicola]